MKSASARASAQRGDGRHLRRERSRRLITDAVLSLIRGTGRLPSAQDVADRAGVTERTVFNLFPDAGALLLAGVVAFREEALGRLPAVPVAERLEERLRLYFEGYGPFLEDYSRIRWAALTARVALPDMERGVVLEAAFRRMLELLGADCGFAERDASIRAALRAAIDPMTWRLYRVQQRLPMRAAAEAMVRSVLALAKGAAR